VRLLSLLVTVIEWRTGRQFLAIIKQTINKRGKTNKVGNEFYEKLGNLNLLITQVIIILLLIHLIVSL
jgi:hypothetical protein